MSAWEANNEGDVGPCSNDKLSVYKLRYFDHEPIFCFLFFLLLLFANSMKNRNQEN